MHKRFILVAFIIPLFVASVAYAQSALPGVDDSTRAYLARGFVQPVNGGRVFVAYQSYGFEKSGSRLYGYIWAHSQEYYESGGQLLSGKAFSSPLLVIYELQSGVYRVIMHQQPMGGSFYDASVRNIFPSRFYEAILSRQGASRLAEDVEVQARSYFGSTPVTCAP